MYFVDAVFGMSYIYILKSKLWKLIVPNGKRLVVTGPDPHPIEVGVEVLPRAITYEDADIIMAYNMIEESVGGRSHIWIVSDDTDVLIMITHQLQARTNNMPATVNVTMEACSVRKTVMDVIINPIIKYLSSMLQSYQIYWQHVLLQVARQILLWWLLAKQLFSNACRH